MDENTRMVSHAVSAKGLGTLLNTPLVLVEMVREIGGAEAYKIDSVKDLSSILKEGGKNED